MMDKEFLTIIIPAAGTIVTTALTGWLGLRLSRLQLDEQKRAAAKNEDLEEEVEFRKSLFELIEKQEQKLDSQDKKIERLEAQAESNKTLIDQLKQANLTLTIENQHLKRRIMEQEQELLRLRQKVENLLAGGT